MDHNTFLQLAAPVIAEHLFNGAFCLLDVRDKHARHKPDALLFTRTLRLIRLEVKMSVSDEKNESRKSSFPSDESWIVCPEGIIDRPTVPTNGLIWFTDEGPVVKLTPPETCLDQPDMKGRYSHDPIMRIMVNQLRRAVPGAKREKRAKNIDASAAHGLKFGAAAKALGMTPAELARAIARKDVPLRVRDESGIRYVEAA